VSLAATFCFESKETKSWDSCKCPELTTNNSRPCNGIIPRITHVFVLFFLTLRTHTLNTSQLNPILSPWPTRLNSSHVFRKSSVIRIYLGGSSVIWITAVLPTWFAFYEYLGRSLTPRQQGFVDGLKYHLTSLTRPSLGGFTTIETAYRAKVRCQFDTGHRQAARHIERWNLD
jgi:hypothetical protein